MVAQILPLMVAGAIVKKRGRRLLGPVDLTIDSGGVTVIVGPNGSGKTTLLRLLHGLEMPRQGSLDWQVDVMTARRFQSFVFQTPVLLRRTVRENLHYPIKLRDRISSNDKQLVEQWLERIGLMEHADTEARYLSGGEMQRVALARALITQPQVLFLDEPTSNLDGKSTRRIEQILAEAVETGVKIVMTTHDLGQAKRLGEHVCFLYEGLVHEEAPASTFFESPKTAEARAFIRGDIVE